MKKWVENEEWVEEDEIIDKTEETRYTAFMFDRTQRRPIDEVEETAEILSYAFNKASRDYFIRHYELENELEKSRNSRDSAKSKSIGFSVFGLIALILGIILVASGSTGFGWFFIITGIILLLIALNYFTQMKRFGKIILDLISKLDALIPKERITFASKMFLPLYIFPFSKGKGILIDPMEEGLLKEFSLVNLNEEKIKMGYKDFSPELDWVLDTSAEMPILNHRYIEDFKPDLDTDGYPEIHLFNALENLKECYSSKNWKWDDVHTDIHGPHSSLGKVCNLLIRESDYLPHGHRYSIKPITPLSKAKRDVSKIEKIKDITIDEELNERLTNFKDNLTQMMMPLIENYEDTLSILKEHADKFNSRFLDISHDQFCPDCIEIKEKVPLSERYDLGRYIMEKFRGSIDAMDGGEKCLKCGYILNLAETKEERCPQCNNLAPIIHAFPQSPQAKAENMIKENIKADLKEIPMQPILSLERLRLGGLDRWKCRVHGQLEDIEEFYQLNEVFSYTARYLWDELELPIRKKADEANIVVTRNRQKFNDQILALLPYDQLIQKMNLEISKLNRVIKSTHKFIESGGEVI